MPDKINPLLPGDMGPYPRQPAVILEAVKKPNGYYLAVDLCPERNVDGAPDPNHVAEFYWPPLSAPTLDEPIDPKTGEHREAVHLQHGKPMTEQQYLENIFELLPAMVEREREQRPRLPWERPAPAAHPVIELLQGKQIQ